MKEEMKQKQKKNTENKNLKEINVMQKHVF